MTDQPRRQHRQSQGTNEEGKHKNDDAVDNAVKQKNHKAQNTENRAEDAKETGRSLEHEGEYPDDNGESRNDRCE